MAIDYNPLTNALAKLKAGFVLDKSEGTPGPWVFKEETGEVFYDDTDGEQVYPLIATVCLENTDESQFVADGYTIAAAPLMRDALRDILASSDANDHGSLMNAIEAARAILDKAKPPA